MASASKGFDQRKPYGLRPVEDDDAAIRGESCQHPAHFSKRDSKPVLLPLLWGKRKVQLSSVAPERHAAAAGLG